MRPTRPRTRTWTSSWPTPPRPSQRCETREGRSCCTAYRHSPGPRPWPLCMARGSLTARRPKPWPISRLFSPMSTPTLHFRRRWSVSDEHSMNAESAREPAPLEVRIHRGAHEIGGNCVELRHGQDTLILDIGKPLTAAWGEVVPLPAAIGLKDNGTRPLGVVISHGHQDHWGLAPQLPTDIPVFIGEGAANILRAAQFWGSGVDLHEAGHLHDRVSFTLGPFTITPYLADHSAYDAFSLLIQAGGRSLFYTGDIRGHGRRASAFGRLLAAPPAPVHAILLEGTSFRTVDSDLPRS